MKAIDLQNEVVVSNNDETTSIKDTVNKFLYKWPVFVIGITFCVGLGLIYLRYAKPIYEVKSTLLIKDNKKAGGAGSDVMKELDIFSSSKVVDNEIEILKSKTLMRTVVERLSLDIQYQTDGRIKSSNIYISKPIKISASAIDSQYFGHSFVITFPNISTFMLEDKETGKKVSGPLGVLHKNVFGIFKVDKTSYFEKYKNAMPTVEFKDPAVVTDNLLADLTISLSGKLSTVLDISLKTSVPEMGADILRTLILVYNEAALLDKNRTTQNTIKFIDDRLALITGELTEVEKDVEGFKSSQGLTNISSEATLYLENVKANDARLNENNLKISVVDEIERYLKSNTSDQQVPSTLGIDDPVLLSQIAQLADLQLKKDQLLATTQPNNPLLVPVVNQIERTKESIKATVQSIKTSLVTTKLALEGFNETYQKSIKKIPTQERQFISIERQRSIKESLYLYLLQKKEETAISFASSVEDSRVVDQPYFQKKPVQPRKPMIYFAALIAGLILPICYLYIKETFNSRLNSPSDLSKLTDAPVLGEIFFDDTSEAIVVHPTSRKAIAEQFRAVRTNMQFLNRKAKTGLGNVTLVTSSMSGEGKSFVATNLAAALAIGGKKTVLIELDLRKPKVSKYMNLPNKLGLSNYLIGQAKMADIVQQSTVNSNLFIVGSGPVPPNPSELIVQTETTEFIQYLKENFDEIIIDTPPVGLVTDAQILANHADSSIYLVRQHVTFKEQIKILDKLYKESKFPRLNIIFNGVIAKGSYGYGYGYGYGYYSDDERETSFSLNTIWKNLKQRL